MESTKLNISNESNILPGFINAGFSENADLNINIQNGLPFDTSSASVIYSNHLIEELSQAEGAAFLRECRRVLQPGGILRIVTFNLDFIVQGYQSKNWFEDTKLFDTGDTWIDNECEQLNLVMREWNHKWLYNEKELKRLTDLVGFNFIGKYDLGKSDHKDFEELENTSESSFALEFEKPKREKYEKPLVSVLIPAYKTEYFRESLESAINQSYKNLEIIISDDNESGEIKKIVDDYVKKDKRIKYYKNDKNLGEGGKGNYLKIFTYATGYYIKYLNDDDILHVECVKQMIKAFSKHPEATLVTSYRQLINNNGETLPDEDYNRKVVNQDSIIDGYSAIDKLLGERINYIGEPTTVMFRKEDLENTKPTLQSFGGRPAIRNGDVTMWVNLLNKGDLIYLTDTLSYFRLHETQRQKESEYIEKAIEAWKQIIFDAKRLGLVMSEDLPQLKIQTLYSDIPSNKLLAENELKVKYKHLNQEKLKIIDEAFTKYKITSFADLGGVWGVNGGYTFYAMDKFPIERAYLVDTNFTESVLENKTKYPQLKLITGNFGEQSSLKKIAKVDSVFLFDVLLHQVNPNWDKVLKRYSKMSDYFIIYNQQFINCDKTVRLLDLGKEGYFKNVPHNESEGFYPNLFDKLDEMHPQHKRKFRDIHNIWQWGIIDTDLYDTITGLGYEMNYYKDCGQFGKLENFEDHAFIFAKSGKKSQKMLPFEERKKQVQVFESEKIKDETREKIDLRSNQFENYKSLMKKDWNERAKEDGKYYVHSTNRNQSEEEFDSSGQANVEQYVANDLKTICGNKNPNDLKVLEIGCGLGRMTKYLADIFGEVHGIDVSGEMVSGAKARLQKFSNVFISENNGVDLSDFGNENFDFVFSFIVFQHIPSKKVVMNYIRDAHRVLMNDGVFKFQVQGSMDPKWMAAEKDTWHGETVTPDDINQLCSELGFTLLTSSGEGTQYSWYTLKKSDVKKPKLSDVVAKNQALKSSEIKICPDPVFVVGCPRSGTSVMSFSLGKHSQMKTGPESNFLEPIARSGLEAFNLGSSRGINHWLSNKGVEMPEFMEYLGYGMNLLYTQYSQGKRWIDQTPQYTLFLPELSMLFPGSVFVNMIRDGRDVVNSMLNSGFPEIWATDFKEACTTWNNFVLKGLEIEQYLPSRIFRVYNEYLKQDGTNEMQRISNLLKVSFEESTAENFVQNIKLNSSYSVENNQKSNWRTNWTADQREVFSQIAGKLLVALGYENNNSWINEPEKENTELPDINKNAEIILSEVSGTNQTNNQPAEMAQDYQSKLEIEQQIYENKTEVHELPSVHDYVNAKYLSPKLKDLTGKEDWREWWIAEIDSLVEKSEKPLKILSLACGNGETEIEIVKKLKNPEKVKLLGIDINDNMIQRAEEMAKANNLENACFKVQDVNDLKLKHKYDVVLANHSLHHFVELEKIFETIRNNSTDDMIFLINDMIGRNGHVMWENTELVINEIWNIIDEKYKKNNYSGIEDFTPVNNDCSKNGFEGVRAEDILPLLSEKFKFCMYLPFSALIGRFIERTYGANFNISNNADMKIIDLINELDEKLLNENKLAPTQAFIKLVSKKKKRKVKSIYQTPRQSVEARKFQITPEDYSDYIHELEEFCQENLTSKIPLVSIVIPVYNNLNYTQGCLKSIMEYTEYENYEIIFIDNASTDGTSEFLHRLNKPNINVLSNSTNEGFVVACNIGAEAANGDYVFMLNNDTEVQKGWLSNLVKFAEENSDCGAVGSKLVFGDGTLQEAGGIIFSDGNGWNYGRGGVAQDPRYNFVREVDYCSGAALMIRKKLWDKIGGFDQKYSPAYYEDTDICFSIREQGYKVYFHPHSVVVHHEGKTAGTDLNSGYKKYQQINHKKFVEKWVKVLAKQQSNYPQNVIKASDRRSRKNILVMDPFLPYFDRASGSLRLLHILKMLKKLNFHVTFIARNGSLEETYKPVLENLGIETISWDTDAMRAAGVDLKDLPSTVNYEMLFTNRFYDYAVIDFWDMAEYYLPIVKKYSPNTKVIIDSVDIHFIRELRQAELNKDEAGKKEALRKKTKEIQMYKKADEVWVVTENDKQAIKDSVNKIPINVVPNIHTEVKETKVFSDTSDLLFVGNFNHPPNVDAVKFLCKEILPAVFDKLPDVKIYVVGNNPTNEIQALSSDKIIVTGFVEDLNPYLKNARISVNPLRYGAGMKGKIGEALSWGLPIVSTEVGAEGMSLEESKHALIAEDAKTFSEKIVSLYNDEELWQILSTEGKKLVNQNWSPATILKRLEKIFNSDQNKSEQLYPEVSIVILTFNALEYTKKCIQSIQTHTKIPHEIIFVDNGSTDGTKKYLKELVKDQTNYRLINNSKNVGFAAGNNQGVKKAKSDYVMLLNNDVEVSQGWLQSMLRNLQLDKQIGMVGPITNCISGLQQVKDVPYKDDLGFHDYAKKVRELNEGVITPRRRIAGFAVLMSKKVYDELGGFDSTFGTGNFEDDDLCLRVRGKGYAIMVDESTFIHHYGSQTFNENKINYLDSLEERKKIFKNKWPNVNYDELLEIENPLFEQHDKKIKNAYELLTNGDAAKALEVFKTILTENPISGEGLLGISYCCRQLQKFNEAVSYLKKLTELQPDNAIAFNQLGLVSMQNDDLENAEFMFTQAIEKDNTFIDAQRNYATVLIEKGDFETGIVAFNKILENHPDDIESLLSLAQLNLEAKRFKDCKTLINKVVQIDPENALAKEMLKFFKDKLIEKEDLEEKISLGQKYLEEDNLEKAEVAFNEVLNKSPENITALYGLGLICQLKGNVESAKNIYERVTNIEPQFEDVYNNLGILFMQEGKVENAIEYFKNVLQINPDNINAQINISDALVEMQQYEEGIQTLMLTLKSHPREINALLRMGNLYREAGKESEAEDFYHKVLEIEPGNEIAREALA